MPTDLTVANEILRQIGTRNRMAVGSRQPLGFGPAGTPGGAGRGGVSFRVGGGARLSKITVTLTGRDDYDVEYVEMSNRAPYRTLHEHAIHGIYAEQLGEAVYNLVHHKGGYERRRAFALLRPRSRRNRREGR